MTSPVDLSTIAVAASMRPRTGTQASEPAGRPVRLEQILVDPVGDRPGIHVQHPRYGKGRQILAHRFASHPKEFNMLRQYTSHYNPRISEKVG